MGETLGVIDLRLAVSIEHAAVGKGGDGTHDSRHIALELAERTFELRAASAEEAREWLEALHHWHDWAIEHDECVHRARALSFLRALSPVPVSMEKATSSRRRALK